MPGRPIVLAVLTLVLAGAAVLLGFTARESGTIFEPVVKKIENAPPCPWRDAESGLTNWFPGATRYQVYDAVLSGQRELLQARLGRPLQPEEMALHTYEIRSHDDSLGTVLTRRFKGGHGAVEIVLALDRAQVIRQFKIQRLREPDEVAAGLEKVSSFFAGKSLADDLRPRAAGPAQGLAEKIGEEVRALLILREASEGGSLHPHH